MVSVSGCGYLDGGVAVGVKQCLMRARISHYHFIYLVLVLSFPLAIRSPAPDHHIPTPPIFSLGPPPPTPIPSLQPPQPHKPSLKQSADPSSPSPQPPTRQSQRPSRANSAARSWLARRLRRRLGSGFARTRLLGGLEPAVGR